MSFEHFMAGPGSKFTNQWKNLYSSENKLKSVTDCETRIYKLCLCFKAEQEIKKCLSSSTVPQSHN